MTRDSCKKFETCNAPLCPMEVNELRVDPWTIWYPDEAICSFREFQSLDWIKKQKLIAKRHGSLAYFFNLKMLNAISQVRFGIVGGDPKLGKNAHRIWLENRSLKIPSPEKSNNEVALVKG